MQATQRAARKATGRCMMNNTKSHAHNPVPHSKNYVKDDVVTAIPRVESSKWNQCLENNGNAIRTYHSKFPEIPTMTSRELVDRWNQQDAEKEDDDDDDDDVWKEFEAKLKQANGEQGRERREKSRIGPTLLLDCRSKEERAVSLIPGAVPFDSFEKTEWMNEHVCGNNHGNLNKDINDDDVKAYDDNGVEGERRGIPTIILYCTVGYRSGSEARKLTDDLVRTSSPDNGSDGTAEIGKSVVIYNLDGILSYTFVKDAPPLVSSSDASSTPGDEESGTKRVHSYGKQWSSLANPDYDVVYFPDKSAELASHLLQTGLQTSLRWAQHKISYFITPKAETKKADVEISQDRPRSVTEKEPQWVSGNRE